MQFRGFIPAAVLALAVAPFGAAAQDEPKPIHASGCVRPGVEAKCIVLRDEKTGKLYNLRFNRLGDGKAPEIGMGIDFTAMPFDGMSYCMQGAIVEVTEWKRNDTLKCAGAGQTAPKPVITTEPKHE